MSPTPQNAVRLLIVDDDEVSQEIVRFMLVDAGFTVSVASTAWAALDLLEAEPFELMITDMVLPGELNGLELVRYSRARRPWLKSLFVSGQKGPIWDDPDLDNFISKPFWGRELVGCVYELLSRALPATQTLWSPARLADRAVVEAKVNLYRPTESRIERLTRSAV